MKAALKSLLHRAGIGPLAESRKRLRLLPEYAGSVAEISFRGHRMLIVPDDDRVFFIAVDAQGSKIDFLRSVFDKHGKGAFFDIGANYGEFSLGLHDVAKTVLAIEPNPIVFFCLSRTIEVLPNVRAENVAIADGGQSVPLAINPYASGGSSVCDDRWSDMSRARTLSGEVNRLVYIDAKSLSLSEMLGEADSETLIVIKMDVEGFELRLLAQATEALRRLPRVLIFFESNATDRDEQYLSTVQKLVDGLGLHLFSFHTNARFRSIPRVDQRLLKDNSITELILTNLIL